MEDKKCFVCGKEGDLVQVTKWSGRCPTCNSSDSKMKRVLKGDEALAAAWDACMTTADKHETIQKARELSGDGLKQHISESINKVVGKTLMHEFAATGVFKDKEDLEEVYAAKPDQLANIFRLAQTIVHPTRQVTMWEDLEFSTLNKDKFEQIEARKLEIIANYEKKKKKGAKRTADGECKTEEGAAKRKTVPASTKNKAKKQKGLVEGASATIEVLMEEAGRLGDYVASQIVTDAEDAKALLDAAGAAMEAALQGNALEKISEAQRQCSESLARSDKIKKSLQQGITGAKLLQQS